MRLSLRLNLLTIFCLVISPSAFSATTPYYVELEALRTTFGRSAGLKQFQGAQSLKDNHKKFGLGIAFGTQFVSHFGMELGAHWHDNGYTDSPTASLRLQPRSVYFDLIGYPWTLNDLSLSANLGLSLASPRLTATLNQIEQAAYTDTTHKAGLRFGLGINWAMSSHAKTRFQVVYQTGKEPIKYHTNIGLGLLYFF